MPYVYKDRFSEYYEECKELQEKCPGIYSSINGVQTSLDALEGQIKETALLVPRFGDEYDSLGMNTKVNIEAIGTQVKEASQKLGFVNGGGPESSTYYKDAKEKDDKVTEANRRLAEERLNRRVQNQKKMEEAAVDMLQ